MIDEIRTKFDAYVCFGTTIFDNTPDSEDDSGEVAIPTVTLDGKFTIEEVEQILDMFNKRLKG